MEAAAAPVIWRLLPDLTTAPYVEILVPPIPPGPAAVSIPWQSKDHQKLTFVLPRPAFVYIEAKLGSDVNVRNTYNQIARNY